MPTPTVVDAETPVGLPLSARFKQSFAFFTMTSRNPDILQHTIDSLRENPPGGADVETLCKEALAEWMASAGTSREELSRILKTATRANAGDLSMSAGQVPDPEELLAITAPSDDAFVADQSETAIPYYVSDATLDDLWYLLDQLSSGDAPDAARSLATDWKGRLQGGPWTATAEFFWTYPLTYDRMPKEDPMLYAELQQSALTIFKGDVNFRKLVGDMRWPTETRLEQAVRGFRPCPMAALRTIKSETAVGLMPGQEKQLDSSHPGWMTDGQLALIVCVPEFI